MKGLVKSRRSSRPKRDRTRILYVRQYDEGEHRLIGELITEVLALNWFEMVSYDPPYDRPEEDWPYWLIDVGSYNAVVSNQTEEQIAWMVENAPTLISFWLWLSKLGPTGGFSLDDCDSMSFEVPVTHESVVLALPAFNRLDALVPWERREEKPFWRVR